MLARERQPLCPRTGIVLATLAIPTAPVAHSVRFTHTAVHMRRNESTNHSIIGLTEQVRWAPQSPASLTPSQICANAPNRLGIEPSHLPLLRRRSQTTATLIDLQRDRRTAPWRYHEEAPYRSTILL
jgi:hypothetical protein